MSFLTLVVLAAMLATIVSLASGISSMAVDHEIGHVDSAHWMEWRVTFQAIAFLMILFAIYVET